MTDNSLLEKLKNSSGSEDYRNASPIMRSTLVKLIHEDVREYYKKKLDIGAKELQQKFRIVEKKEENIKV